MDQAIWSDTMEQLYRKWAKLASNTTDTLYVGLTHFPSLPSETKKYFFVQMNAIKLTSHVADYMRIARWIEANAEPARDIGSIKWMFPPTLDKRKRPDHLRYKFEDIPSDRRTGVEIQKDSTITLVYAIKDEQFKAAREGRHVLYRIGACTYNTNSVALGAYHIGTKYHIVTFKGYVVEAKEAPSYFIQWLRSRNAFASTEREMKRMKLATVQEPPEVPFPTSPPLATNFDPPLKGSTLPVESISNTATLATVSVSTDTAAHSQEALQETLMERKSKSPEEDKDKLIWMDDVISLAKRQQTIMSAEMTLLKTSFDETSSLRTHSEGAETSVHSAGLVGDSVTTAQLPVSFTNTGSEAPGATTSSDISATADILDPSDTASLETSVQTCPPETFKSEDKGKVRSKRARREQ